jgi:hypothetical protein
MERMRQRPAVERARTAIYDSDVAKYTQARMVLSPQEWSNLFGQRALDTAVRD